MAIDKIRIKPEEMTILGDFNWQELRNFMILQLMECKSEYELKDFISKMLLAIGNEKHIKKIRKQMGLKDLSKEDIEKMKEIKNDR